MILPVEIYSKAVFHGVNRAVRKSFQNEAKASDSFLSQPAVAGLRRSLKDLVTYLLPFIRGELRTYLEEFI